MTLLLWVLGSTSSLDSSTEIIRDVTPPKNGFYSIWPEPAQRCHQYVSPTPML